ncbi:MAG: hypothetical protein GY711_00955 [bacterium]|nr:hypothetical protein [bacterium]
MPDPQPVPWFDGVRRTRCVPAILALLAVGAATSCGGGGGGGGSADPLRVVEINVSAGQEWKLNRAIEVRFDQDVQFSSVNGNTLQVREANDPSRRGIGSFELVGQRRVRWQPFCPTLGDLSDAGLHPATAYELRIPGGSSGIRSKDGGRIEDTVSIPFQTPTSTDPAELFDDVAGPPAPVLRDAGSGELAATYVELGRDDTQRVYFERGMGGSGSFPAGFTLPLNPYSVPADRVAWIVQLDQAIFAGATNLARIGLEYEASLGSWQPLGADVELEQNCGSDGARLRITPLGLLPQGVDVRVRLAAGLQDLVGETLAAEVTTAGAPVAVVFDPGTTTPGDGADGVFETFATTELADETTPMTLPRAAWGPDGLAASWSFAGTGGPGADFDWYVPAGSVFVLDTTQATIEGGPGGAPITSQTVTGGIVDVRDVFIPATSRVVVVGPNPLVILATGSVVIEGELDLDGGDSPGVTDLRAAHHPSPGGIGVGGGGSGGEGSPATNASSLRGGRGAGPFQTEGGGGEGGETTISSLGKNARRGAGGGGGRLGPDILYTFQSTQVRCQGLTGMDAEHGFGGGAAGFGLESGANRAAAGAFGPVPFVDGDTANDFFGTLQRTNGALVRGELPGLTAGTGGGAGGDAVDGDFPGGTFDRRADEKGAGGGAGGGALHVLALGPIRIGPLGSVHADGGHGSGGESTSFRDRVGGGSGGGSGGMLVLESLTSITIEAVAAGAGPGYADDPDADLHPQRPIRALGGQGGAGNQDKGGAQAGVPTAWRCDAIPTAHFDGTNAPPALDLCALAHLDRADPLGPSLGAGGDGGPGLIQLHVPDPDTDLILPPAAGGDATRVFAPPPIGWDGGDLDDGLAPNFGPRSTAQSRWLGLGRADHDPLGVNDPLRFFFGGVDGNGRVPTAGGSVVLEPPLLGPAPIVPGPGTPRVENGGRRIVFATASIAGGPADWILRNPALAEGSSVRLERSGGSPGMSFAVVDASYDVTLGELALSVSDTNGTLLDFQPGGVVEAAWIPRTLLIVSGGAEDALSDDHSIHLSFDAAPENGAGEPLESSAYSVTQGGWARDIEDLIGIDDWRFVRFRVEFDLDAGSAGFDAARPLPRLEFLRVPFRF